MASKKQIFISCSGIIGAGKTTLAKSLGESLNLPIYYEEVIDNAYLTDFYSDMKKYSFPLQIYLLNKRFKQQQHIIWSPQGGVQDRSIYEDGIFAKLLFKAGLMEERDYNTYTELFENMANFMAHPTCIIYLDVSPQESLKRIKNRSRDCESQITLEYLENLKKYYEEFIGEISMKIPVIRIAWDRFQNIEYVREKIQKFLPINGGS